MTSITNTMFPVCISYLAYDRKRNYRYEHERFLGVMYMAETKIGSGDFKWHFRGLGRKWDYANVYTEKFESWMEQFLRKEEWYRCDEDFSFMLAIEKSEDGLINDYAPDCIDLVFPFDAPVDFPSALAAACETEGKKYEAFYEHVKNTLDELPNVALYSNRGHVFWSAAENMRDESRLKQFAYENFSSSVACCDKSTWAEECRRFTAYLAMNSEENMGGYNEMPAI